MQVRSLTAASASQAHHSATAVPSLLTPHAADCAALSLLPAVPNYATRQAYIEKKAGRRQVEVQYVESVRLMAMRGGDREWQCVATSRQGAKRRYLRQFSEQSGPKDVHVEVCVHPACGGRMVTRRVS